jgi:hypothetical protein
VLFEHVLAAEVVGTGQHLVVELGAVGLEQHALGGPAEVGEVAQVSLVDLRPREPGPREDGEDDVLVLWVRIAGWTFGVGAVTSGSRPSQSSQP